MDTPYRILWDLRRYMITKKPWSQGISITYSRRSEPHRRAVDRICEVVASKGIFRVVRVAAVHDVLAHSSFIRVIMAVVLQILPVVDLVAVVVVVADDHAP